MSEMTRRAQDALGSVANDAYFGGFKTALGGLYVPAKAAQVNGNHFDEWVNLVDAIDRRLGNAFAGYVYRDGGDADNQFSVKPFSIDVRPGLTAAYAGATALGALATGTNRVWATVDPISLDVAIAHGASWPSTAFLPLAEIAKPAGAPWLPANLTRVAHRRAINLQTHGQFRRLFTYQSGSFSVGEVPPGATVMCSALVTTAFVGSSPTLIVGDTDSDNKYIQTGDVALATPDHYRSRRGVITSAYTTLLGVVGGSGLSAGQGAVLVEWWL